jgi:hypothetical protein
MPLEDVRGYRVDCRAVADVELLPLVRVARRRPREPDDAPPAGTQVVAQRGADSRRSSRYDGDANVETVARLISTVSSIRSA